MIEDGLLYCSVHRLKKIQDNALANFITKKLYPFSPYYHKLFDKHRINPRDIRKTEDLQQIPFTTKEDLIQTSQSKNGILDYVLQPNEELIKRYSNAAELACLGIKKMILGKTRFRISLEKEYKPVFVTATTGTTKLPVSFFYTDHDLERLRLYGSRLISVLGCKPLDKAVNLFPYAPHLAFWQVVFAGFSGNMFIFSTGGGKALGTDATIQSLIKIKPDTLIGTADYIYHILKQAKDINCNLDFIRRVVLGASRVPPGFKLKLAELLQTMGAENICVHGTYGFTEARGAWAECPAPLDSSSGYHIYPDQEIFEVIDPVTGRVLKEGEDGELVYTPLCARGSCVVRFRTGDIVKGGIRYSPCPHCGRTIPRVSSDIVRASNIKNLQLSKIKGSLVNLNHLEYLLDDERQVDQWQIEISKKNDDPYEVDLVTLYVYANASMNEKQFKERINELVSSCSEITFNRISFVSSEEIKHRLEIESAVKAKKIVDRRPQS